MNVQFLNQDFISNAIKQIGSEEAGAKIMEKKSKIIAFKISDLSLPATMILKQEAISVGGDFATPKECILAKEMHYDGVLFGTIGQINRIITKLQSQPFGLKNLAIQLKKFIKNLDFENQIMAVINITPDSFFADSRSDTPNAIQKIERLLNQDLVGIIDIGGASSRPGSELIDYREELKRLEKVFDYVKQKELYRYKKFSIDTYNTEVAQAALDSGFAIVNDVSGFKEESMMELVGRYKATAILMHTQGTPKEMQNLTNYENLFQDMDRFFETKLEKLNEYGVSDIVLDIGFGFAKNMEQNLDLIRNLEHFRKFNLPILVGASRKNTIQRILEKEAKDCLSGTLALHFFALQNGANILRVHDVEEHIDLLKIYKAYYA